MHTIESSVEEPYTDSISEANALLLDEMAIVLMMKNSNDTFRDTFGSLADALFLENIVTGTSC